MIDDLHFSGIGSGFNPSRHDGDTAAFLHEGSVGKRRLFMIDMGGRTLSEMQCNGALDDAVDFSLLLTHSHSDHSGSLGNLAFYTKFNRKSKLKIYTSEDQRHVQSIEKLLELYDVKPEFVKILSEKDLDGKFDSFDTVRYVPTKHTHIQPSFGLDFTTRDGDIYYTGDTKETTQVVAKLGSGRPIKRIYADMSTIEPSEVHTSVTDYEGIIIPENRHLITGMHFGNSKVKQYASSRGFDTAKVYKQPFDEYAEHKLRKYWSLGHLKPTPEHNKF